MQSQAGTALGLECQLFTTSLPQRAPSPSSGRGPGPRRAGTQYPRAPTGAGNLKPAQWYEGEMGLVPPAHDEACRGSPLSPPGGSSGACSPSLPVAHTPARSRLAGDELDRLEQSQRAVRNRTWHSLCARQCASWCAGEHACVGTLS
jgi:hypothetical protein